MASLPQYRIYAIKYAERIGRRAEMFLGGDPHDAPMAMDYFVWAVVDPGRDRAWAVDTGFSAADAARRQRTHLRGAAEGLALIGLDAAAIRDVVITHLHYDHAGGFADFPAARFHIQDDEMAFATGRCMTEPAIAHAFEADHVAAMVHRVFERRVAFHDGEGELAPGLTLHRVGGHTKGMQIVRVHTAKGWMVLASDAAHYYENLADRRPFWIVHDIEAYLAALDTALALAGGPDLVVPGHDPLVFERFPPATGDLHGIVHRLA